MALPTLTVEIGFGQSAANHRDGISWVDVTPRGRTAEPVNFQRGRGASGEEASAGTCSVMLDNDDASLTPGRSDSPYGRLTTKVPVRIRANAGSGARDLWWGFVTDWAWSYEPEATRSRLSASDILATASRIRLEPWMNGRILRPVSSETGNIDVDGGAAATASWVDADGGAAATEVWAASWDGSDATAADEVPPIAYWPLTDAEGSTAVASGITGGPAARITDSGGDLAFGVASDLSPDDQTVLALTPAGVADASWLSGQVTLGSSRDLALSLWLRPADGLAADATPIMVMDTSGDTTTFPLIVTRMADAALRVSEGGVTADYGVLSAGRWYHVYVERDESSATFSARHRVWVDGAERSITSGGGSVSAVTMPAAPTIVVGSGVYVPWDGQLGHVSVWGYLGGQTFARHLANRGLWTPPAASRFESLGALTLAPAAWQSWLAADADADALMSAQTVAGLTLLEAAQQVAATEYGAVVADRFGYLRLQSAGAAYAAATGGAWTEDFDESFGPPPSTILSLSAASTVMDVGEAFSIDDADVAATAQVTNHPSEVVYTASRSSTADTVSVETATADTWAAESVQAEAVAQALVAVDVDAPRSPTLQVSMDKAADAGIADQILTLELADLIELTDLPATAPASTLRLLVMSIEHANAGQPGWTVTIDTAPGEAADAWLLDDDIWSLLDDTTIPRI